MTALSALSALSAKSAAPAENGSASNGMTHPEANTTALTKGPDTSHVSLCNSLYSIEPGLNSHPGLSQSATAASFVRPTRPAEKPRTFLEALQEKYASEVTADHKPISSGPQIVISGKVAEEIGFDKIRKQQAQLSELKIVILDGMRIDAASNADGRDKSIREVCPKVTELDLSRNMFVGFGPAVEIGSHLTELRGLRLK